MSNFYFSWKSCMKPWIIHKLGNFAWENCYRDITDVVVVQVIAATRVTPVDEHGFGGTALVHDNEMRLTCNFTEEAIQEFELKEESTSGCEFNSDLKNALVALRRYRIVPTFTSNEGDSIFTVVVYSFTLKSFTKLSAGFKDTRMAHKHYRIAKKLKELWSQWRNDRLAFVSDDSGSESTTEVTLSQMIQFMEEAEKMEEKSVDANGENKDHEKGNLADKSGNKEREGESSKERTNNVNDAGAGGSTSVSNEKTNERRSHTKRDLRGSVIQQAAGASFEIPLPLLDKLRCPLHEKCLHFQLTAPGNSPEKQGEPASHSLNELLESIPKVFYTCIPNDAKQGLPEGLSSLDLDVPWDQEETPHNREEGTTNATSSSSVQSCDSSCPKTSQSMEALQWPPGSSSSQSMQPSVEKGSVATSEDLNQQMEHADRIENGGQETTASKFSGDGLVVQAEVKNRENPRMDRCADDVDMNVMDTKEAAVHGKKSQSGDENTSTHGENQEEVMATQPFEIDEHQPSAEEASNVVGPVVEENSENLYPETQAFDITVLTQGRPVDKTGEAQKNHRDKKRDGENLTDGDKIDTASQEFEPIVIESEEILSNEHNHAFLETQSSADSSKPGTQDPVLVRETSSISRTGENTSCSKEREAKDGKQSAIPEINLSAHEKSYNSEDSLEDIFDINLPCASPVENLESRNASSRDDFSKNNNAPPVSLSEGGVIPPCSDTPTTEPKGRRVSSASDKGTLLQAKRKSRSKQNPKMSKPNSSKIGLVQDSDIPSGSQFCANNKTDDDIDWSWILNSPADTQKLDELYGEPGSSLNKPVENLKTTSKLVEKQSQTTIVNKFLEELETLQCQCGESLSSSCDSSPGSCQSSTCNRDGSQMEKYEGPSTNEELPGENQSKGSQSLQEIPLKRPITDLVEACTTNSYRRGQDEQFPLSRSKKTRKRMYRKMTEEELAIPKKKLIEDRLLKWIISNYGSKRSKQK